jgi:SAM-dependent methyltransferase
MMPLSTIDEKFAAWIAALDGRYLADLTVPEVSRALRALSSCYVERRDKLASGEALGSAGKRAAFALYYAPLHFLVSQHLVRALGGASGLEGIVDVGCGTGAAGAAWALEAGGVEVTGYDRHPWAVAESSWTYRSLGLHGRGRQADAARVKLPQHAGAAVIVAYCANELPPPVRSALLPRLLTVGERGGRVLVIEPIARRTSPWWGEWVTAFTRAGGRADEWRFRAPLPARQTQLARAAGLDIRELTARSLYLAT